MASTQQKKPVSSNRKKSTSGKKGSTGKKTASRNSKRKLPAYEPNLLARFIGGGICLFFAVLLLLGAFQVEAVVIDLLCKLTKGLVGYGFWVTPPVLLLIAGLLIFQRKKRVCARIWCAGFLPVLAGALLHLIRSPYTYSIGTSAFSHLWTDGTILYSGGVLGGVLGVSFAAWFSKILAGTLFAVAIVVLLFAALNLTPGRIVAYIRDLRVDDEYGEPYEEEAEWEDSLPLIEEDRPRQETAPRRTPMSRRVPPRQPVPPPEYPSGRRAPDLPIDEEEQMTPTEEEEGSPFLPLISGRKHRFFGKNERIVPPNPVTEEPGKKSVVPPAPIEDPASFVAPTEMSSPVSDGEVEMPVPLLVKEPTKSEKREEIRRETAQITQEVAESLEAETKAYDFPPLTLLMAPTGDTAQAANEELADTMERLAGILTSFGIDGHVAGAVQGPSVTRYEVNLEQGVRLNKLTNLADDVALALGASSVRIAPVPGKISVVGVEVPNRVVIPVPIREVLDSTAFRQHRSKAAFSVGKDIGGNYIVGDCSKLPHMLIAGTTGSGKSVCINSLIISMLYKATPQELRLIMVDPKMVELGGYNGIPHLLIPVVTDPKKAAGALQWAVTEMMKRYRSFAEAGVRELSSYNLWAEKQGTVEPMPKIVIVIDELADLMLVAAKEVEESICRVAQMGRAAGMHLVIATQRPSADVITGLMKANIPSRIAFAVASSLESRIILDTMGAEKLVGKGDMLWYPLGSGKPLRVQGCLISDEEVAAVVEFVKENSVADYDDEVIEQIEQHMAESEKGGRGSAAPGGLDHEGEGEQDELFPEAVEVVLELGQASVSMLQRRLKLGYARAARLMDQMEDQGIVGPFEGSKPRPLLITKEQWAQMQSGQLADAPSDDQEVEPVEEELLPFDPIPQSTESPDPIS